MNPAEPKSGDTPSSQLTLVLHRAGRGDPEAAQALWPLVYDELKAVAQAFLARERPGHTLQATAIVHEAFLRLVGPAPVPVADRNHFFSLAAGVIRRILVDHARSKLRLKRGGDRARVNLETIDQGQATHNWAELAALDDALDKLATVSDRAARVVELKYFGGLTGDQIAERLGVSPRTVDADWTTARAWLARELAGDSI